MKKTKKKTPDGGQGAVELLLVICLISWSGQSCQVSGPLMESIIAPVAEWIPLKDLIKLYELSSTVSGVLKEWLDDQILDSFGDTTWTDMSEEWTEFMYGTAKNW